MAAKTKKKALESAEVTTASEPAPQITLERIRNWGACGDGRDWFLAKFPSGGSYAAVMEA